MRCVLISGIPASGKTGLGKYLSESLRLPMIGKDQVKEILFDTIGFSSRKEKVALGEGAMQLCYYFAEQLMKRGIPFLLENNFENSSKPMIKALLERYHCRPVTLLLTGDKQVIYRRFLEREYSPDRHRGHVVNTCYPEPEGAKTAEPSLSFEQFVSGIESRGMENFDVGEDRIIIDTTDFSKVDRDGIARQVKALMESDL